MEPQIVPNGTLIGIILSVLAILGTVIAGAVKLLLAFRKSADESHRQLIEAHREHSLKYVEQNERMITVIANNNSALERNIEASRNMKEALSDVKDTLLTGIIRSTQPRG